MEKTQYIQVWLIIIYYSGLKVTDSTKILGNRKIENSILLGGIHQGRQLSRGGFTGTNSPGGIYWG